MGRQTNPVGKETLCISVYPNLKKSLSEIVDLRLRGVFELWELGCE
jgi:hypothetical protein